MRAKLADILHLLARLASLPDANISPAPSLAEAYTLRLQAYKDFATVAELQEGSKFEPGGEARKRLETAAEKMKALLLYLLAIIQHRADLRPDRVPAPLREASARFRTTLANMLDILSDRLAGRAERPVADVHAALAELEQTIATQINGVRDTALVGQIRSRLALYQEATPPLLSGLPHVQLLRQIWVQHYFWEEQQLRLRKKDMLPPAHLTVRSPYDPQAHFGSKRDFSWFG